MLNTITTGHSETQNYRQPPHNLEAEQALLGAILVNNDALDRVLEFLSPNHFFDPLHGRIFETLAALIYAGKTATPVTVKTFFENVEPIDAMMTVPQYLGRLAANATTIINAAEYGRTIYDLATRRSLILIGEDMVNTAYDAAVNCAPALLIEEAEQRLFEIAENPLAQSSGTAAFSDEVDKATDRVLAAYQRGGALRGISTGFADLDAKLGGLKNADLLIIGARPSMGKTSLATNITWNVAKSLPVGFFSLEMTRDELVDRIISSETDISAENLECGNIRPEQMEAVLQKTTEIRRTPFHIDDRGGITIAQLATRARRMKRQHGIVLLVVDYLQLMFGNARKETRVQEITEITTGLKALAKELAVPIIALSQLSRQVEQREDKRPQLSDLRESGSIEQDADVVLFVYREEYYLEREKPDVSDVNKCAEWQGRMLRARGKAEIIIAKHRHGPIGTMEIAFEKELTRFSNLARSDVP